MGNVRNPVGPLPSSIYWRRRAVVLCLFAIVAALVVWLVLLSGSGPGGARRTGARGPGGHSATPLPSITPGPTASQTGITTEPGGRTSGGSDSGASSGGSPSAAAGGAGGSGGTDGGSAAGGTDGGGTGGTAGSGGGSGARLPAGTSVPDCTSGQAKLEVRSVHSSYAPGQRPTFAVTAVNSGATACKVNFSAVGTVVTITDSAGRHLWASDDCPPGRTPYLLDVPAGGSTIDDVNWNRTPSAPQCATPSSTSTAGPGAYHVKVAVPGLQPVTTAFTLAD